MRKLLKILLLCVLPSFAFSQAAVHLNCISALQNGDVVLTWNVPTNACPPGCFVAYNVFYSKNWGPYTQIATINNAATTTYTHVGISPAPNDTLRYFIQTECNCGGGSVFANSDTANHRSVVPPAINNVTVTGNGATINWSPSTSVQAWSYIIYYYDPSSAQYFPVDTVYGYYNNTYTDTFHDPNKSSVALTVAARDSCGSAGAINSSQQNTIFLKVVEDRCNHSITLNWNDYKNWPHAVQQFEIYQNTNSAGFVLVKTLSASTFTYSFNNVHDGDNLCFYVKARENILNDTSSSNQVCLGINVVQPPAYTMYQNASVFQNSSVNLIWIPDVSADLQSYNILRSSSAGNYTLIQTINVTKPLVAPVTMNDATALVKQQAYYYFIQSVDSCGKTFSGTHCNTIYLSGDISSTNQATLHWNEFSVDSCLVHYYDVFRSNDGGANFVYIGKTDSATLTFQDDLQSYATSPDSFCYRVIANFTFKNKLFQPLNSSLSNDWCTHCNSAFFAPNTIFPKGKNNLFKPIITFPDILNYQMIIFNRYGEKIFISNDYSQGWNGTLNGTEVPQGNYTYLITFEKADGKKFVQQGNVVVIY